MYVYIKSEKNLWTVGFYTPDGKWNSESDHSNEASAAERVHWLNGGQPDEDLDPTVNHYDDTEDLDDEAEGSWEEVLDQETGAVWRIWTVNDY